MLANELVHLARQSHSSAVEEVVVPEWDNQSVKIGPVSAQELYRLQRREQQAQATPEDQEVAWALDAEWLRLGLKEPVLSIAEASSLLNASAGPVTRLLGLIKGKSYLGSSVEGWAIETLATHSPEARLLADVYNNCAKKGSSFRAALADALQLYEGGEGLTAEFSNMETRIRELFELVVEDAKMVSLATEAPSDSEPGEPA